MVRADNISAPHVDISVVVLNDYAYPQGGGSQMALLQARLLHELGHQVTLFTAMLDGSNAGRSGWLANQKIPTWVSGQWDLASHPNRGIAAFQGLWNFRAASQLDALLSDKTPKSTVVLVHSWTKALSASAIHCALRRGFTVVLVAHDYFISCPNGAYYDFQQQSRCHRRPMSFACASAHCDRESFAQKQWRVLRHAIQKWGVGMPGRLGGIVCVSEFQRRMVAEWLPESLSCYVLPNLVPAPPADLHADVVNQNVFGYCGRLSTEKGVSCFVEAAQRTRSKTVFIGDGPLATDVRERTPDARITGWLGEEGVWAELARIRALVFPSVCAETFGLSVYEAAALGVPAIIASGTAPTDFVRDGINGLRFRQGDASDLAEKMMMLVESPDLARTLGLQARIDVRGLLRTPSEYAKELAGILRHCA